MRDSVLYELANRWERDAEFGSDPVDDSPEGMRQNDVAQGRRECKRECADTLRMLIQMLGDK